MVNQVKYLLYILKNTYARHPALDESGVDCLSENHGYAFAQVL